MAPEFIEKYQISIKSDIYSLGVIMINLLTGCRGGVKENVRMFYISFSFAFFYNKL